MAQHAWSGGYGQPQYHQQLAPPRAHPYYTQYGPQYYQPQPQYPQHPHCQPQSHGGIYRQISDALQQSFQSANMVLNGIRTQLQQHAPMTAPPMFGGNSIHQQVPIMGNGSGVPAPTHLIMERCTRLQQRFEEIEEASSEVSKECTARGFEDTNCQRDGNRRHPNASSQASTALTVCLNCKAAKRSLRVCKSHSFEDCYFLNARQRRNVKNRARRQRRKEERIAREAAQEVVENKGLEKVQVEIPDKAESEVERYLRERMEEQPLVDADLEEESRQDMIKELKIRQEMIDECKKIKQEPVDDW